MTRILLRDGYMRDSINRMDNGQANHLVEFRKSKLTKSTKSLQTKDKERYSEKNCEKDLVHMICDCVYNVELYDYKEMVALYLI